ncbi:hybrid sensor histidine kinase/response regulator [Teichococcus aestuarii]|uniref:Chemotaxis protein CheA n=1 Tax=Teichococcus aestuarii TaxID=568898 RepID=A0A2U1V4C1_9PROT|nr:chemotaxis protein CheW [Pseudoroseomonas aestuarii]PWC28733.1 hybrid sensor histidine kinase/response regulator [Pseudoroseomonas aestuarii]
MDDLIAEFLTETNEALAELDTALVQLERAPDGETLARIFRLVHTVKGTCGFFGLSRLEGVAHAAENLLGLYRDGERAVTPEGVSAVLASIDAIRTIMAGLAETGAEPPGDDAALRARLEALAAPEAGAVPPGQEALTEPLLEPAAECEEPELPGPLPTPANDGAPTPLAAAPAAPAAGTGAEAALPVQAIRVSLPVLDDLMTLASELVLVRNQLLQVARSQGDSAFSAPLQRLSRITSELQEGVMKTRMQPVSAAWSKLPRLVRDLGQELGKRIELVMTGGETELDRQVLELIRDPLTHMVRNCADHGLEGPEERRRAGKPEAGRILLSARQEGGRILIQIADDGRGLDLDRVRRRALERGLVTEAALAGMDDADVARFVFRPGFSTAEAVTAVSGRGVGMDVVRTNIERIGGSVDLRSSAGRGTTLTIRIPLTLAIISGLIVQAEAERFAVPQAAVVELVRVGPGGATLEWVNVAPVLRLRGQLLPLVPLGALLGLAPALEAGAAVEGFVAVLHADAGRFGLLVDGVFDTEEIVVKPVAPILRDLAAFSGNTILGDGGVIMILDPGGVARLAGLSLGRAGEAEAEGAAQSTDTAQLLLFRAGGQPTPLAVPLGLVARLEALPAESIELVGEGPAVQYRGRLMPLLPVGAWSRPQPGATQQMLVFQEGERMLGLMVDEILDVVQEPLALRPSGARPGFLGSAIIAGRGTDVLDCAHWLRLGDPAWFGHSGGPVPRLLVVEDSGFFRQIVVPALSSAGYAVTECADAAAALALREKGAMFDAVLTDIEMPGMDGFDLLAEIRRGGPWAALPVVALTSRTGPRDMARGHAAGFNDYVAKFDRDRVLAALGRAISGLRSAA